MNISLPEIVARISTFDNDRNALLQLDEDTMTLFDSGQVAQYLNVLFGLFERFPNEDNEVFWGIMHGTEDIPGYEAELVQSINRKPSTMGVIMLNRLLNAAEAHVGNIDLVELLHAAAANPAASTTVREWAEEFVAHQAQK